MRYIAYQRWSSLVPALFPRREIEMNEPATHLRMPPHAGAQPGAVDERRDGPLTD